MAVTKAKKKVVKKVSHGIAHVVATNNNTRITITDQSGAVLTWATAGANNFKGAKKSTPYVKQPPQTGRFKIKENDTDMRTGGLRGAADLHEQPVRHIDVLLYLIYTRRTFFGRQPLCGMRVVSVMD